MRTGAILVRRFDHPDAYGPQPGWVSGQCAPVPAVQQPVVPSVEWTQSARACEGTPEGTCSAGSCFEPVAGWWGPCISSVGDVACPAEFPTKVTAYDDYADRAAGRTRAQVVSAKPLSDDQRERLRRALAARTGQQVELDERVDSQLLGGAIASVGGLVFDGSLRTQLSQLRTSLTRGQ